MADVCAMPGAAQGANGGRTMTDLSRAISVPARIALAVFGTLCAMLAAVVAVRPDMMAMPMHVMQRLIVGFGL